MTSFTRAKLRHALSVLRQGRNPAATVYDSIGADFFLAPAPGWLNLGLWEGPGSEEEAPHAVRRLVETLAGDLPPGGTILDVGNGLGVQDVVIAEVAEPRCLVALNVTESQLRAGRAWLAEAGARPVLGDAMRIPLADASVDGAISVEAAFHFRSRRRFFREARRVLRPGGILTMSDVPALRFPRGPVEWLAGITQIRLWGMRAANAERPDQIATAAESAGLRDVRARLVGERVIPPVLRVMRARLRRPPAGVPRPIVVAARVLLSQVELLWRRRMIDYLLLRARAPG